VLHWFVLGVARWFAHDVVDRGRLPLLCCLIAFILTFFVTRTSVRFIRHRAAAGRPTRWWQPRNVYIGGVHIHHVTFGVILVMLSGLTLVTLSISGREPEFTLAATLFGIGAALVLDEYALILHLSDVYWEEDGRTSVDAVFAAVAVGGLVVTLPLAVVVVLKGKVWTGLLGMFLVVLLVIGAIRLSRPHAPWARWRYTTQPDKMRRALQRERRLRRPVVRVKLWVQCTIAGTPRLPDERAVDAQLDLDVHAASAPTVPILISR
jgi:hypothetical protein